MKICWIKSEKDKETFQMPELLGLDVFILQNNENIDYKIDELILNKYHTIIISKDLANFSQKINNEYLKNKKVNIIIGKK